MIPSAYLDDPNFPLPQNYVDALVDGQTCSTTLYNKTIAAIGNYDLRLVIQPLKLKVLIIFGEHDPYGLDWAREEFAAFSRSSPSLEILPHAGHSWEEDSGAFFSVVNPFLNGR